MNVAAGLTAISYNREYARDLAGAASQIVPVLLIAAIAIPHLRAAQETEELDDDDLAERRVNAALDLGLTALLVGLGFCAEFVAVFGVISGGLTRHDVHLLEALLFATGLAAVARLLTPLVRQLSEDTGWPKLRITAVTAVVMVGGFWGVLLWMNSAVV